MGELQKNRKCYRVAIQGLGVKSHKMSGYTLGYQLDLGTNLTKVWLAVISRKAL